MTERSTRHAKEDASSAFFDGWAKGYETRRISPWFQYTQELAIGELDLAPDSAVLDVGCGTGHAVRRLAGRVPQGRACGIDISPSMIAEARRRVPRELQSRVELREASSAHIPYATATFTHAICTNSFHHYPDPIGALREIQRVLVPGGQLVIFENAPDLSWYTWLWDRVLRLLETGHVRYYPSAELGRMLEQAGFADRRLCALRNELRSHGKLFASIQLWSARSPRERDPVAF